MQKRPSALQLEDDVSGVPKMMAKAPWHLTQTACDVSIPLTLINFDVLFTFGGRPKNGA